jgi:purine-binding chemotaxis protein CheW
MTDLFLIAAIAGHRVAFRTARIQSVIDLGQITPAPSTPAFVAGLAALRSRPMTVIDCAVSLALADVARVPAKALVAEAAGFLYALSVDDVEDVVWIDDTVHSLPAHLPDGWERAALGMVRVAEEMLLLLDVDAVIRGPLDLAA